MIHFNWLELIDFVGYKYVHTATAVVVSIFLAILSLFAYRALKKQKDDISPSDKFSLRGVFEFFTEAITNLNDMVMGKENRRFVPMFASIFLIILVNNIVGLVPGMTPATENINTTVAIGIFSFTMYNFFGLKENGLNYLKHFLGPVLWLAWLLLPIELISHLVRPMSLGLRLMGSMQGDHTVLGIFLDLAPIGVPMIFYGMGLFISLIQSFIFTLLSMVYMSMAVAHDDH